MCIENKTIFEFAKKELFKSNPFTFFLSKALIPHQRLPYFCCWYTYFRLVDNIADADNLSFREKLEYLDDQIRLLNSFYTGNYDRKIGWSSIEANLLNLVICFDKVHSDKQALKPHLTGMLECIKFDVVRSNKFTLTSDLTRYFNQEVLSYLNTFNFFLSSSKKKYSVIETSKEGVAGKWVHVIRDLLDDISNGIINISTEEMALFEITSIKDLNDISFLKRWAKSKAIEIQINFEQGKKELLKHSSIRYKILVLILCLKYELYLRKIKHFDYIPQPNYVITKIEIVKEIPRLLRNIFLLFYYHLINSHVSR